MLTLKIVLALTLGVVCSIMLHRHMPPTWEGKLSEDARRFWLRKESRHGGR